MTTKEALIHYGRHAASCPAKDANYDDCTCGFTQALRDAAALGPAPSERMFPIMDGPNIPWSVIAPCARQAQRNHSQSLERLAERGGLGPAEAIAILECRSWSMATDSRQVLPRAEAIRKLLALVAERQAASVVPQTDPHVSALLDRAQALLDHGNELGPYSTYPLIKELIAALDPTRRKGPR